MGTLLHRAEPGLAFCTGIKALSVRIEEFTRDFFGERARLPDLRRASLLWGSEAEEVRAPFPPCCFSVFSCERRELAEDFFAEHVFICNTGGDFCVCPSVFQAFCSK